MSLEVLEAVRDEMEGDREEQLEKEAKAKARAEKEGKPYKPEPNKRKLVVPGVEFDGIRNDPVYHWRFMRLLASENFPIFQVRMCVV